MAGPTRLGTTTKHGIGWLSLFPSKRARLSSTDVGNSLRARGMFWGKAISQSFVVMDAADSIGRSTQCVSGSMDASQYSYSESATDIPVQYVYTCLYLILSMGRIWHASQQFLGARTQNL